LVFDNKNTVGKKKIFFLLLAGAVFLLLPPAVFGQDVVINEFSALSSPEWVELYNRGGEIISLTGWEIRDGTATNKVDLTGLICPFSFRVFYFTKSILNNDGDEIRLFNNAGKEINKIVYFSELIPACSATQSVGRKPDGGDLWEIFSSSTPQDDICLLPTPTLLPSSVLPTATPTIAITATPTPSPTKMPTPSPEPAKATYQINEVKNEKGEALSSVKIYVDDQYIHHYAPEVLEFCNSCYCDDDKKVACGFGEHVIRLEKNGYQDWEETKEIKAGDAYLVNPVMVFLPSPTPTPTATPVLSLSPTGRISPSPSLAITSLLLSPTFSSPLLPFADFALAPKKITSEEEEILEENSGQVLGEEKKEKKNSGWYFGVGAFYLGASGWRLARRDDNDIMEKLNFEEK